MRPGAAFAVVWFFGLRCVLVASKATQLRKNEQGCCLSKQEIDDIYEEAISTWHITDDMLRLRELQNVVDCASEGDILLLNTSKTIKPPRHIKVTKRLVIQRPQVDGVAEKAKMKCPPDNSLFLVENASLTLDGIAIKNCAFSNATMVDGVVEVKCNSSQDISHVLKLTDIDFVNNRNPGGSSGIYVHDPDCVAVEMNGVVFRRNVFLFGSRLARRNNLTDVEISQNVHVFEKPANGDGMWREQNQTHDSKAHPTDQRNELTASGSEIPHLAHAFFVFSRGCESKILDLVAEENAGMVLSVEYGSIAVGGNSRIAHNIGRRIASIIAVRSNVTLTGVLFQNNIYDNRSAHVALCRRSDDSIYSPFCGKVDADSCIFVENSENLQIAASFVERNTTWTGETTSIRGESVEGTSEENSVGNAGNEDEDFTSAMQKLERDLDSCKEICKRSSRSSAACQLDCPSGYWSDDAFPNVYSDSYYLPCPGSWTVLSSTEPFECLHKEACPGYKAFNATKFLRDGEKSCQDTVSNQNGLCGEGYEGPLCGSCSSGYGKVGMFRCSKCIHKIIVGLTLLASLGVVVILSLLQIRGNLDSTKARGFRSALSQLTLHRFSRRIPRDPSPSRAIDGKAVEAGNTTEVSRGDARVDHDYAAKADKEKTKFVQTLKIAINFAQVASAVMYIDLYSSSSITQMQEAIDWIGSAMDQGYAFSIDCMLPTNESARRSVMRTVLSTTMPLSAFAVISMFWVYQTMKKHKRWGYLFKRFVLTAVAVLYISYLTLIRTALNVFYCVNVDRIWFISLESGEKAYYAGDRWALDTSIECPIHGQRLLTFSVAIVVLSFMGFYTLMLLIVLIVAEKKDLLSHPWISETLGFLFKGFRKHFAFWDCLILLRKALIALIVYSIRTTMPFRSFLLVCLLLISLVVHLTTLPFQSDLGVLNHLESASLIISTGTLQTGILFLTQELDDESQLKTTSIVIVLIANIGLLCIFLGFLAKFKFVEMKFTLLAEDEEFKVDSPFTIVKVFCMLYFEKGRKKIVEKIEEYTKRWRPDVVEDSDDEGSTESRASVESA